MNIVKRWKVAAAAVAFSGMPSLAIAADANLQPDDFVGISFWLISMALVASTVFFFIERDRVDAKWKTSLTVSGLVTLVAAVHYFYMRDVWVSTGETPTVYRYIDWLITVPLQVVEFYLIMAAIGAATFAMFRNLMAASIVMLVAGFFGESGAWDLFGGSSTEIWWVIGMAGWVYILYALWAGDVKEASESGSDGVQFAFTSMRWIVSVGWAIYPIGYMMGNDMLDGFNADDMNIIYNIADLVNKTAFGMMVWYAAKMDS